MHYLILAFLLVAAAGGAAEQPVPLTLSGPIVLDGVRDIVIQNLKITSVTGDCISIRETVNVVIQNSEIGPCAGNGIRLTKATNVSIYDNYIHPEAPRTTCCDRSNGIWIDRSSLVKLQGNVIAFGQSNIQVNGGSDIWVFGNFLFNPQDTSNGFRGHQFQSWGDSRRIVVSENYLYSSHDPQKHPLVAHQEDAINFGLTDGAIATRNFITGGRSRSGCGVIVDWGTNQALIEENVLLDTGQCGIGVSSGRNHVVSRNRILNSTPVPAGGNVGIYVWKGNADSPACGTVRVAGNIASHLKTTGMEFAYWNGGGCEPVSLADNIFDAPARAMLSPAADKLVPPRIPPHPFACAAPSPFTNRTGCNSPAKTEPQ